MKVTIERAEVKDILRAALAAKLGGQWECLTPNYGLPAEVEFEQPSEETKAERADRARRVAEADAATPTPELAGEGHTG